MLTQEGWEQLDRFFDVSLQLTGNPPEYALFDPQLAEYLDKDWLVERAHIEEKLDRSKVEELLANGLVAMWSSKSGKQGFIPYSTRHSTRRLQQNPPFRLRRRNDLIPIVIQTSNGKNV